MVFLATNMTYFLASWFLHPESNYMGRRPPLPAEQIQASLEPYHLSSAHSLLENWWSWLTDILLHWNWGRGFVGTGVVNQEIGARAMVSAELMLLATILSVVVGVAVGVHTASHQYGASDRTWMGISVVAMNLPIVVVSVGLVAFGVWFNSVVGTNVFLVTGNGGSTLTGWAYFVDFLKRVTLPTIGLIFITYPSYHLTQRSLLLDNIEADYVRTARAKGLTRQQAIRKHALRTSIIPIVTSVAFSIPGIFTGAVLTENIYAWSGIGQYTVQTIAKNDVNGAVAVAAFSAVLTALGAILSDIFVVIIDPRVRVS